MAGRFSVQAVFKAVDRVTAPVSRMQQRMQKFTRSMERGLRTVAKATKAVASGIAKVGRGAVKLAGAGLGVLTASVALLVREFSKVEDAQAAFTPLLGSVAKAKDLVDALNTTAATTPFQFENLASAANQLLPVMNGNIEDTIKTLRMLGDTAGGNAQKLEAITRGFTKAMLKGKVDMESLNMIAEAGVPIFGDLADVMGTKVNAAFFKMISAGKVTTTQLTAAFEKMTSKGGIFFGGMEIASRTTSGMLSTLKDNISLTAAELGGVLAPTVKEMITAATEAAKRVREWVKGNKELIADKFVQFVQAAKTAVLGMVEAVKRFNREYDLPALLSEGVAALKQISAFLKENGTTILKVVAAVVALSVALNVLVGAMTLVNLVMALNPVGLIVIGILALSAALTAAVVWIDDIDAGLRKMTGVVGFLLTPLKAVVAAIKAIKDGSGVFSAIRSSIATSFGFGEDGADGESGGEDGTDGVNAAADVLPQIVSPQDRVARSIEERRSTSTAEVTLRDETGRAEVTGGSLGPSVKLQTSGAL